MKTVYFCHGKESGPWGKKITALASIAQQRGWQVNSVDFRGTACPEERVELLLKQHPTGQHPVVLVGSSMGAYVATVASMEIRPAALFLMAPAFYLPGYKVQDPAPQAGQTVIVQGWRDEVVPSEHVLQFANKFHCTLHLVNSDHTLLNQLPLIEREFAALLDSLPFGGERELLTPVF